MKNLFSFIFFDKILTKKYKILSILLVVAIFVGFLIEMIGLGLILPLVSTMFDKNKLKEFEFFIPDFIDLDKYSHNEYIYSLLLIIFILFSAKNILLFFQNYFVARYTAGIGLFIQKNLIKKYLNRSLHYFNTINSTVMIRNLTTEISVLVSGVLIPFFSIMTEVLIVVGIFLVLIFYNPKLTLLLLFMVSIVVVLFKFFFIEKLRRWGALRQLHSSESIKKINNLFFLQKEIKVFDKENYFSRKLYDSFYKLAQVTFKKRIIHPIPRLIMEITAILIFCLVITFLLFDGKKPDEIFPILAVLVVACFRIVPSFNRIAEYYSTLRYGLPSLEILIDELNFDTYALKPENYKNKKTKFEKFEINNLNFNYKENTILRNLKLEINKKDMIGIVGKSGAGKSTLLNVLLGLYPTDANIFYNNTKIEDIREWLINVCYVPQDTHLLDGTIKENIAFGIDANKIDNDQVSKAIEQAQLSELVKNLKDGYDTKIGENGTKLSGGQKQRIGIARALYPNPEILIFDEVTSSLDLETENNLLESILNLKNKKTILIVTHRTSLLRDCNKIFKLVNGELKKNT
mgnify:FL=1